MKEISCKCGASKKRFKLDIGPFFINECCIQAGFNHLGVLKESEELKDVENNSKRKQSKKSEK